MRLILVNKPHHCLSQFTDDRGRRTLADCVPVPDVYAAGRLDYDSEGLLLLTDHGGLQSRISHPRFKLEKTYLAQVEGNATQEHLDNLHAGVPIRGAKLAAKSVRWVAEPEGLWPRQPPIRERQHIPDCWIKLVIDRGVNRQVRRMTAAVGLPTLRLIRTQIGPWELNNMLPGEWRDVPPAELRREIKALGWRF